jgi:hypothetical protein
MAAPNLINANTIVGRTTTSNLTSTAVRTVLDNPANSGKVLKVNTLNLCNYNTSAVIVTVFYSNGANTTGTANGSIAGSITVPSFSTLNIIDKTSQYYLEENTSFGAAANAANCISVSVSYEDIS